MDPDEQRAPKLTVIIFLILLVITMAALGVFLKAMGTDFVLGGLFGIAIFQLGHYCRYGELFT